MVCMVRIGWRAILCWRVLSLRKVRLANNAASQRFQEYLGEDLAVLAKHYGLDLAAFRDMERYMDENKRKIRDAIVKDKKETA